MICVPACDFESTLHTESRLGSGGKKLRPEVLRTGPGNGPTPQLAQKHIWLPRGGLLLPPDA